MFKGGWKEGVAMACRLWVGQVRVDITSVTSKQ